MQKFNPTPSKSGNLSNQKFNTNPSKQGNISNKKFMNQKPGFQNSLKNQKNQKLSINKKYGGKVLSLLQLLAGLRQERQEKIDQQKIPTIIKPIIPPKTFVVILTKKPKKIVYNRRIIDYKHCGLLQRYLGLGGKILPRRQTRLSAKQQRFVAKAIKTARVMALLPFVSKERGFFR